ncbi:MAG: hypothetical protein RL094_765 [Candidatus Parcubacteria bacterium]|jgi:aspartyl-tRNA(Asn)/glutamyl-tRNA(Gln) amidotransferase subunit C
MSSSGNITQADIKKLASLSRMQLSDEEAERYTKEIDSILAYVEQIKDVTADVDTTKDKTPDQYPHRNMLRDDVAAPLDTDRDALVKLAPESQDGYIKVKKILN